MIKKIIAFLLIPSFASANIFMSGDIYLKNVFVNQLYSLVESLQKEGDLYFFKDFTLSQDSLDADFSKGSPTATLTATRSESNPATYFDSEGLLQTATTSNSPRWTQGWYSESGWKDYVGLLLEGASTNLITKSNNFEDAIWDKINITADNDDTGSSSIDGAANAPSLTATDVDATLLLNTAVTAQAFSIFLKRKTGTGLVYLTADGGTTWSEINLSSGWGRYYVIASEASNKCGIKLATSGDAVYVFGSQFENVMTATSYIPTTSATVTRNAETLTYPSSGNHPDLENYQASVFISYYPITTPYEQQSSSQRLYYQQFQDGNNFIMVNYSSNVGNRVEINSFTPYYASLPGVNQGYSIKDNINIIATRFGETADSESKKMVLYNRGNKISLGSANYARPAGDLAATFQLGYTNNSLIIKKFALFSDLFETSDIRSITTLIEEDIATEDYLLAVGDSITRMSGPFVYKYFSKDFYLLGSQGSFPLVYEAYSGYSSTETLARMATNLENFDNAYRPNKLLVNLHIGTNDISLEAETATIVANVEDIMDMVFAYSANAEMNIALIIPRYDEKNEETTAYNTALLTMLNTYKSNNPTKTINIVDFNSAFLAVDDWENILMTDAIHPGAVGQDFMGALWYKCYKYPTSEYCNGN